MHPAILRTLTVSRAAGVAALDFVYPNRCVGCHRHGTPLCSDCLAQQTPATGAGRCGNCSAEWPETEAFCPRCSQWLHLDGAIAAFEHERAARAAVHALKYARQAVLAAAMAPSMALVAGSRDFDAVIAIPLHPSRQKRRGFNQAARLTRHLDIPPLSGKLRRLRKTSSQVGMSHEQRRRNVAGAFSYEGPELDGLRIALVDDVVTTGATANECAAVLKDYGAASVTALSFTRASYQLGTGTIED